MDGMTSPILAWVISKIMNNQQIYREGFRKYREKREFASIPPPFLHYSEMKIIVKTSTPATVLADKIRSN